jgi:transposase
MRKRKKYPVKLTDEQRDELNSLLSKGKHSSRKLKRAQILLLSDQQKGGKEIAENVGVAPYTVYKVCERFTREGFDSALNEKPRPGAPTKLDTRGEAFAIATACSEPPEGRVCWTMQMIADKVVELKYVDSISDETVRLRLKKKK